MCLVKIYVRSCLIWILSRGDKKSKISVDFCWNVCEGVLIVMMMKEKKMYVKIDLYSGESTIVEDNEELRESI